MKITPEEVNKMNFGKVIADDVITFLERFSRMEYHRMDIIRLDDQCLFFLLRILFHMQLYRLYSDTRNPAIDKAIDRLIVLVSKRISPDRIGDLITVFTELSEEGIQLVLQGLMDTEKVQKSDLGIADRFGPFYNDVNQVIEVWPDDFRMLLIKLIDLADTLSSVNLYPVLRREILGKITNNTFRSEHRTDLWTSNRRSMMKTFRSLVMMERLPYLLTVLFAIIGFLVTNLLNEYKDMCIVKYDHDFQVITLSDILVGDYGKTMQSNQGSFTDNPCPQCKSSMDNLIHLIKNICGIKIDGNNKFYKSTVTFRNISKYYLKNIDLTFKFKGDDRVIMGFAQTSSLVRSDFADPEVYGTKASFRKVNMPPGSNIILELITNTPDLPMNLYQTTEQEKIFLMKSNRFNWIIDSRLNTIYMLIVFSALIIILNLILYAKFSSEEV